MTSTHPQGRVDLPIAWPDGPVQNRSLATWHRWANAVVVGWLALTVAAVLARRALPASGWLAVHLFLLGAVTSAILIWSEHFAVTLLRAPRPDPRRSLARLATLNAGVVALLYGVTAGHRWPAVAAAGVVVAVVAWHAAALVQMMRRALPGRFGYITRWYVSAGAMLITGGTLGGLMVSDQVPDGWHERMHAAHAEVNVFGWVGLTVLGTLFTLWPTILGTRMPQGVGTASRWSLRLATTGLVVAVVGLLCAVRPVAAAGLALYAAAAALTLRPLVDAVRQRRPHNAASWMVGCALGWFLVVLAANVAVVALQPPREVVEAFGPLLPLVLLGFVGQVLLGSLTHLLPVVLSGGPARRKQNSATMNRAWLPRLVAANVAVPLLALPVPRAAGLAGLALAAAALGSFVVLALTTMVRAAPVVARPAAHRPSPALAGVVAGCLLTAAAVAVAMSGSSTPTGGVTVQGGQRTVDVTLATMRIRPATIEVTPGTSLVLRVVNRDAQRHDLRLATGEQTPMLGPNKSATLRVGPLWHDVDGWCTVPGHRAAGMTLRITLVDHDMRHGETGAHGTFEVTR